MSTQLEAVTSSLMKLSLDAAALRHQAIAANIANAATPGHAPVRVSFQRELQRARERMLAGEAPQRVAAEAAGHLRIEPDLDAASGLDLQAARLAENVVRYQALIKAWSKRTAILAAAMNDGRR